MRYGAESVRDFGSFICFAQRRTISHEVAIAADQSSKNSSSARELMQAVNCQRRCEAAAVDKRSTIKVDRSKGRPLHWIAEVRDVYSYSFTSTLKNAVIGRRWPT